MGRVFYVESKVVPKRYASAELLLHLPREPLLDPKRSRFFTKRKRGVYAIFSPSGELLYIGACHIYLPTRLSRHVSRFPGALYSWVSIEDWGDRVHAERFCIWKLQPTHNIAEKNWNRSSHLGRMRIDDYSSVRRELKRMREQLPVAVQEAA